MGLGWDLTNYCFGGPTVVSDPANSLILPDWLLQYSTWFLQHKNPNPLVEVARWTMGVLLTIGVWGLFGGVLARRSVIELATITSSSWIDAWKLVASRWLSIIRSVAMPWLLILAMLLPAWILGVVGRFGDIGLWIAQVGLVVMVPLVVGIAWLVVQSFLGFPLSLCAIVTERKADAFDGFSRSAAYLLQRPFTILVGVALGTTVVTVVGAIITWGFGMANSLVVDSMLWASGREAADVSLWSQVLVQKIGQAFAASYLWTASAAMYLTLRNEVDQTDFDDLDLPTSNVGRSLPDLGKPPSVENNPDLSGANETAE